MKEIKWLLQMLACAAYTSLWWATIIWKGLCFGVNNVLLLVIVTGLVTIFLILLAVTYCMNNWDKK